MKIRQGFVSNSSSSSFTIMKKELTPIQIEQILDYDHCEEFDDCWNINDNEDTITGWTHMDNDDIEDYFKMIEINSDIIMWDSY